MATSVSKGQISFRAKGQTTCIHHQNRQLDRYCEKCQEPACTRCLSTVHRDHTSCDLSKIIPPKREDIQNFIDKSENVDLVQINQYITSTDTQIKDNTSHFEKLSIELWTQTNKLKGDLDLLTARTMSLFEQMEEDNTKLLQTYKQALEMYSTQLKQHVQECKISLQRGSNIQICNKRSGVQSSVTLPVKPTLGTVSFTPRQNPQGQLKQALGEVNTSGQGQGLKVKVSNTQQNSTGRKDVSSPVYTVLPQTKVLCEWESPCFISSVCPTTDGQVWTSDGNNLTQLDRKGEVQEIYHNALIRDISLSPTTNTLWICDWQNNITELVLGRPVNRFITRELPQCICITASNHVLVGMAKHISKFSTKGVLVRNSLAVGAGMPLVCTPHSISECPLTHNVAVSNRDSIHDDGEGKPYVVVMDTYFKKLFVYDGEVPHTRQPTSQSGWAPFNPRGVVYDSVGNLVIGDRDNKNVLLISGRGEFIRIIHIDNFRTVAVGIDRDDVLWAVFGLNNVKLIEYTSALDKQQCIIS